MVGNRLEHARCAVRKPCECMESIRHDKCYIARDIDSRFAHARARGKQIMVGNRLEHARCAVRKPCECMESIRHDKCYIARDIDSHCTCAKLPFSTLFKAESYYNTYSKQSCILHMSSLLYWSLPLVKPPF